MKVVILAAGFGTRVSHLTGGRPKALMPYLGVTLLDALVQALPENTAITLVSNAKYLDLFHEWARMTGRQLRILNNGITDPGERKGALFDLALGLDAAGRDEPVVVFGSDSLFQFDLSLFFDAFHATASNLVGVRHNPDLTDQRRRGVVGLSANGKITRFEEKPDHPFSTIAATALYGFQPAALLQLNDYLAVSDDVDSPGHFVSHLVSKMDVRGWFLPGELIDYGHASVLAKQLDQ
ncbi:MAG: hypothetical protein CMQ23_04350 [Gammaproteobacteria bacterium]|nr:hypothetical protein [Gammaproteobacteria bacterium]